MSEVSFRPLSVDDLPLLHAWLNQSHMRSFYQKTPISLKDVIEKYTPRAIGKVPTYCHIVFVDNAPIGKIQCYRVTDYPSYAEEIGVSDGISVDLFIGDPTFLGKGLGKVMLATYLKEVAFPKFPGESKCYICHEKSNHVALSCSKAVGFEFVRDVVEDGGECELLTFDKDAPQSQTVSLVPSHPDYAELWLKWRSEPNTVRYNPIAQTPLEDLRIRMTKISSDLSNLKGAEEFQFFIQFEGQLVGTVSLKNVSHMMMYGEIGYDVSQVSQGQGIGSKAVAAFVEKIFAETHLRRLFAYVAKDNIASRRVLEKAGFVLEGICREHYVINGVPTDEVLYGLLRSEFEQKKSKAVWKALSEIESEGSKLCPIGLDQVIRQWRGN